MLKKIIKNTPFFNSKPINHIKFSIDYKKRCFSNNIKSNVKICSNEDNNNNKKQSDEKIERSLPPPLTPPQHEKFYQYKRVLIKILGVSFFIWILYEINKLENVDETTNLEDVFLLQNFELLVKDKDYETICKKLYEIDDKKALYIIYHCFYDKYTNYSQIKLIESGLYKYCIDYLLKHKLELQHESNLEYQKLPNENSNSTESNNLVSLQYFLKEPLFVAYYEIFNEIESLYKSDGSNFDQNSAKFRYLASLLYKPIIIATNEYNNVNKLPELNIPSELNLIITKSDYSTPISIKLKTIISKIKNSKQYKKDRNELNLYYYVTSVSFTFIYMLFRSNKRIFPNFNHINSRWLNIISTSLSVGSLMIINDNKNREMYDQKIKDSYQRN